MESLQSLDRRLARLQKDYQTRLSALQEKRKSSAFPAERQVIQEQIDRLIGAYKQAFENLENARKETQNLEDAQASKRESLRLAQENELKVNALREWVNAGGDPQKFEDSWSSIRDSVLNERVLVSLMNREKESHPDLSFAL